MCSINNDLWFLISAGRKLLEKGFVKQELLTYHTGLYGIQQQWPIAIVLNLLYKFFGIFGPYLFGIVATYLIIFILIKILNRINFTAYSDLNDKNDENNKNIKNVKKYKKIKNVKYGINLAIVSIVINVFAYASFITTRPYVFSTFLLLCEIYLLESFFKTRNVKYLYSLPVVSILIINCHASVWMMFYVFLLPYLVDLINLKYIKRFFKNDSKNSIKNNINDDEEKQRKSINLISLINCFLDNSYEYEHLSKKEIITFLIIIIICILCGFINPYGIDAITYGFNSYGIKQINDFIDEMKPTFFENSVCLLSFLPLVILPMITFVSRILTKNKNVKMRYLYYALGTGLMTLMNRRNAIFFIVIMSMNIAYAFSKNTPQISLNNLYESILDKTKKNIVLIITLCVFFMSCTGSYISINSIKDYHMQFTNMFNYLDATTNKKDITLFAYYDVGGHAEFYGYKPFMDPRAEVLLKSNNKKEDYFIEFYDFFTYSNCYDQFLNKYKFTHLIIPDYEYCYTVQRLKKDNHFRYVMKEDGFILFESIKYQKNIKK